jgi:hypothetical protein
MMNNLKNSDPMGRCKNLTKCFSLRRSMERSIEMKKGIVVIFVVLALLLVSALPGQAFDRGHWGGGWRGGVWIGPGWGWGWGPGWAWDPWLWGPPYYDVYNPYYAAPPVVIQQPQQYVQPAPQAEEQSYYWYFCGNPQGYYPYVKKCPSGWMKVVPPSTPPDYGSKRDQAPAVQDQRR